MTARIETSDAAANAASATAKSAPATSRWLTETALWRAASIALFCAAWEIAGRVPINPAFPTFLETLAAFVRLLVSGALPLAYLNTLQPLALGVLISAVAGVLIGVAFGLRPALEWLGAPVFIVLQAAPVAALIPLVTFVYGIGLLAKTVAVCLLALPVIVLNSYKAVRNVSPSLLAMSASFLASPRQQISKIILPDAAPVIFAGLRLGVSAGFIGVVLAELLITPTGIGDLITYHRSVADYAEMYAVIASIVAFSAVTLSLLQLAEVRLFRPERRGG